MTLRAASFLVWPLLRMGAKGSPPDSSVRCQVGFRAATSEFMNPWASRCPLWPLLGMGAKRSPPLTPSAWKDECAQGEVGFRSVPTASLHKAGALGLACSVAPTVGERKSGERGRDARG